MEQYLNHYYGVSWELVLGMNLKKNYGMVVNLVYAEECINQGSSVQEKEKDV